MTLPLGFFDAPFAHRALHGAGRPENSREAIAAAVEQGFGIEIDVQLSRDGQAMVFHDYGLERLTGVPSGTVQTTDAAVLTDHGLLGGPSGAPTLREALGMIGGRVPVAIEIKDQDGAMGCNVGALEAQVSEAIASYAGPLAVMSFNPHAIKAFQALAPNVATGLVTCAWTEKNWPLVPAPRRAALATLADVAALGVDFVSHDRTDLASDRVARLKAQGIPILCWTIRSQEQADTALQFADQITFEGYVAA